MDLQRLAERCRNELFQSVLPFWLEHSLDTEYGGQWTCLDRRGRVFDHRKYVWLQGRAVWMFSKLYNQVEQRPEWLAAARSIVEFLRPNVRDEHGRCYFSLTRAGRPAGYQRKPYAAVFVALGYYEYAKATGNYWYREQALDLYKRIQHWIDQPALLDRPQLSGQPSTRALADVMVTLSLALEFDDEGTARSCVDRAFDFYRSDPGVFAEYEGAGLVDLPESRLFCPGHSIEVAWFLLHALERYPDPRYSERVLNSIQASLETGWDAEYGGLTYFVDLEGRPPLQLEAGMKLWWPHTEALYGLVLAASLTGIDRWASWLKKIEEYSFSVFSDPEFGEWFGYCDRNGKPALELKGNNYKGCFHVPRALLYSWQRLTASAR